MAHRTTSPRPFPSVQVMMRTLRIIYLALVAGVLIFAGITLGLSIADPKTMMEDASFAGILAAIAGGLTLITALVLALLGGSICGWMMKKMSATSAQAKLQAFLQSRILLAALAEGPALLWCVLTLLTRQPVYLAGTAFCLFLMLVRFPTVQGLEDATGTSAREIDQEL